jgi:GT2 family glycosyltransferase
VDPLVSIIVPTYNRAYCIGATLESALAQTHRELDVIVVDDGSTDGTRELVQQRFGHDRRVRYVHKPNGGVASARNRAIPLVRGEYVAFLDSDDLWQPWKLELQLDVLRRFPEAGMVWTDMDEVLSDGGSGRSKLLRSMYGAYRWYPTNEALFDASVALGDLSPQWGERFPGVRAYRGDVFSAMIMGNLVYTSSVLLRRERLRQSGSFREDMKIAEDYDFHLRTCRAGPVAYVDVSSVRYQRGRPDQLTRPELHVQMAENFFKTILPVLEADRARITLPKTQIDALLAESHEWLGVGLLDHGRNLEATWHLALSLRRRPGAKKLGYLALSLLPPGVTNATRRLYRSARTSVRADS